MDITFTAGLDHFRKDKEGQVRVCFQVPLTDAHKVLLIPHQTTLNIGITFEDTRDSNKEQDTGHEDL